MVENDGYTFYYFLQWDSWSSKLYNFMLSIVLFPIKRQCALFWMLVLLPQALHWNASSITTSTHYNQVHMYMSKMHIVNLRLSSNTSIMRTPGIIGLSGKCPGKKLSLIVTFLIATAETPGLYSITLSTKRKGNLQLHKPRTQKDEKFRKITTKELNTHQTKTAQASKHSPVGQDFTYLIDINHCRKSWEPCDEIQIKFVSETDACMIC